MDNFVLPKYDDIFSSGNDDTESIVDIDIQEIDEFLNHPFKVLENEDMKDLVSSIKEYGVITPATVRKKSNNRYELISGHRRKKASELLGLATLPCRVVEVDDIQATAMMLDGNLQRSKILPSEKAYAYKMRLDVIKNSRQNDEKGKTSVSTLADEVSESEKQIQRYIRLTLLIKPLLDLVDDDKLKLASALEFTYINESGQNRIYKQLDSLGKMPSTKQAKEIKEYCLRNYGYLPDDYIKQLYENVNVKEDKLNTKTILSMIPGEIEDKEDYIIKAIKFYNSRNERHIYL